ncbi:type II toxin-antitoxin system VapC family toxin [Methylobacterium frigidaeris]|uniref:tRNA(fMet)-specific endonuclease VapC n=1 Tax=Methylobacterium frigidaeris TaxID=2038277 RepID=A0AA37HCB6_9HYPH|nr:type II toxin-antitoxin system VapC family toxin [Methylobacterium frigidaeris]PIK74758.1 PIN domain nuclease [Methylobacterium frigidaeris]GJD63058.1 tRNA(fMet)-specific endonuclease VapC [Methylobacterium frigidaeris]
MNAVLLDTHAWVWRLSKDDRLSSRAAAAITAADQVFVSPVSFFEIAQKVRIGKWPEMESHAARLAGLPSQQGGLVIARDPEMCIAAGLIEWIHRDPFDRLLAATAQHHRLPLVSADAIFDGIVTRVW